MRATYLRIEEGLHKQLRYEAAERDESMNACIISLLQEALEARRSSVPIVQRTGLMRQSLSDSAIHP